MNAPKLPLSKKIWYGLGAVTMNLPDLIVLQWLLVRYAPPDRPHLVPAGVIGAVILCARVLEALAVSPIGHWTDTCRSRWGRRMPFMRLGIVPLAAAFFLMLHPPVPGPHWLNAVHAAIFIPSYFVLYGICIVPYLALIPEITSDLKDRVDLTTVQSVFIMLSTFAFAAAGWILQKSGWTVLAGSTSVLMIAAFLPVSYLIDEKRREAGEGGRALGLRQSVLLALRNRPFRYFAASIALYWFGLNAMLAMVPHWAKTVLGRGEDAVTVMMAPFLVMNLLFFFVFNHLAGRIGKYKSMLLAFFGSGAAMALFAMVGRIPAGSQFAQSVAILTMFGAPVAGFMVLPFAVLGDVVDYDEKLTGRRREAIFVAGQSLFQKLSIGLSVLTFTLISPYGADSKTATPAGLKLMAIIGAVAIFGAFLVFLGYPLRERSGKIVVHDARPERQEEVA